MIETDESQSKKPVPEREREAPRHRLPLLLLFGVLAVALGLRLYVAIRFPVVPQSDAGEYHQLATDLAEGDGYVTPSGEATAFRPPAYPWFVAGVYLVSGPNPEAAYVVQAVLSTLTVLFLTLFVNDLFGRRPALLVGLIAAIYPGLIWMSRLLLTENLTLFLLAATLWVALKAVRTRRFTWATLLGILLGLGMLARTSTLLVSVIILTWMVLQARANKEIPLVHRLGPALLASACALLVLIPWHIRNDRIFDRFFFVSTQDGHTLYASYWPPRSDSRAIWGDVPRASEDPAVARAEAVGDEAETAAILRSITFRRLAEEPSHFFELIPVKLFWLSVPLDWEILPQDVGEDSYRLNVGYILALPLAAIGAVSLLRRRIGSSWLLLVIPVSVIIQTIVFYGGPRFRLPAELSLLVFAGVGLESIRQTLVGRRRSLSAGDQQPA